MTGQSAAAAHRARITLIDPPRELAGAGEQNADTAEPEEGARAEQSDVAIEPIAGDRRQPGCFKDILQVGLDVGITGRKQAGALIVQHRQARFAVAGVCIGQVVELGRRIAGAWLDWRGRGSLGDARTERQHERSYRCAVGRSAKAHDGAISSI
jgi:hypothetical protein